MHSSQLIKEEARRIGFIDCRISRVESLAEHAAYLSEWIRKGMYGEMNYMIRNYEKRINPALLVENTKSIISLAVNYFPEKRQNPNLPQIAKYAYGIDYHVVVKDMLYRLLDVIKEHYGNISGRVFTDSAPVLEHAWAERSGLGWIGKHSLVIHPQYGSFLFLGELFLDMEIEPDTPATDRCGSCTRCMDACPVKAIVAPRIVDARRCLSYLTVEYKGTFDPGVQLYGRLFGCDICQDACPWNKKAKQSAVGAFKPNWKMLDKTAEEWQYLSEEEFKILTINSPVQRAGFHAMKRNAEQIAHHK